MTAADVPGSRRASTDGGVKRTDACTARSDCRAWHSTQCCESGSVDSAAPMEWAPGSWTTTAGLQKVSSLSSCSSDETVTGIVAKSAMAASSQARRVRRRARVIQGKNTVKSQIPSSKSQTSIRTGMDGNERSHGHDVRRRPPHTNKKCQATENAGDSERLRTFPAGTPAAPGPAMVPISRGKQVAGAIALVALGYALSWVFTPGPGTPPVKSSAPAFDAPVAPAVVTPQKSAPSSHDGTVTPSKPSHSSPNALQESHNKPI